MRIDARASRKLSFWSGKGLIRLWVHVMCNVPASGIGVLILFLYVSLCAALVAPFFGGEDALWQVLGRSSIDEQDLFRWYGVLVLAYDLIVLALRMFLPARVPRPYLQAVMFWSAPGVIGWTIVALFFSRGQDGAVVGDVVATILHVVGTAAYIALQRGGDRLIKRFDAVAGKLS